MDEFNIDDWKPDDPWINFRNKVGIALIFLTFIILYFTCN